MVAPCNDRAMRVCLGSDHAGFELKGKLLHHLAGLGHDVIDCGAETFDPEDDYPSFCITTGVPRRRRPRQPRHRHRRLRQRRADRGEQGARCARCPRVERRHRTARASAEFGGRPLPVGLGGQPIQQANRRAQRGVTLHQRQPSLTRTATGRALRREPRPLVAPLRAGAPAAILAEVKASYRSEIEALSTTYGDALTADVVQLRRAVHALGRGPAIFIGSGGAMVLAELAARLHEWICRQPGRVCTSLEALDSPPLAHRGALLFSSSAKHPDAQRVLLDFQRRRFVPAVLITHRDAEEIRRVAGCDTRIVTLPELFEPDGFLATGSIMQTAALLLRAYLPDAALPPELQWHDDEAPLREELIVLSPPSLRCVAIDLEVRFVESGLAAVQLSDYRNFAHGRHAGFARRRDKITIVALSDRSSESLATRTLAALPTGIDVRRWHADTAWETAVVELLARSMRLTLLAGERTGVDVARPRVPTFGRRLYRLPLRRRVPDHLVGGVERKLLAARCGEDEHLRGVYAQAATEWLEKLSRERFAGIVCDYDGTVCWTERRFEPPEPGLQECFVAMLEGGAVVGFASGRGRSLHADLRRWIPRRLWSQVVLGLYNGGFLLALDDELRELRAPTAWSQGVVAALAAAPYAARLEIVERGSQVSVGAVGVVHDEYLARLVADRLDSAGVPATIASSGHAVDIMPATNSKLSVASLVEERAGGAALGVR